MNKSMSPDFRNFTMDKGLNSHNKLRISGTLVYHGAAFRYALNEQPQGAYLLRGRVVLLSAQNGKVLQIQGERRRAKLRKMESGVPSGYSETLAAHSQINLDTKDENEIRKKIEKAVIKLYAKNDLAIKDDMSAVPTNDLHPAEVVRLHFARFLNEACGKVTEDTQKRKKREMEKLAAQLDAYSMNSIPLSALQKIFHALDKKKASSVFHTAERFWYYCAEIGVYHGKNPFEQFFRVAPRGSKKTTEELQKKALTHTSLPEKVEQNLIRRIENAPASDSKTTGLLLIAFAYFHAGAACALRWCDLEFNAMGCSQTTVQFLVRKDRLVGATHDYTRPAIPFCARELYRRYRELQKTCPKLNTHFVLEDSKGKPLTGKVLTDFCRDTLHRDGMSFEALAEDRTQPGGVGVRLLLQNYQLFLTYECGLADNSGATDFLMGKSMQGNVTADHYTDYACPDGQRFLYSALSRDKTFEPSVPQEEALQIVSRDGETKVNAVSEDPRRFTHVTAKILLHPGERLDISSLGKLDGSYSVKKAKTE